MIFQPRHRSPRPMSLLPRRAGLHLLALGLAAAVLLPMTAVDRSRGQAEPEAVRRHDVIVFALRAVPGESKIDSQLASVAAPLRRLMPGHGLTLIEAATDRLEPNQSLECGLGDGLRLEVVLVEPLDDGAVRLRVECLAEGRDRPVFVTNVRTPTDQPAFLDKALRSGDHLLIGVGVR